MHYLASFGAGPWEALFDLGGVVEGEGRRPEEIFKLLSLKCHFLDFGGRFDRILMVRKQRFSMLKFTI